MGWNRTKVELMHDVHLLLYMLMYQDDDDIIYGNDSPRGYYDLDAIENAMKV